MQDRIHELENKIRGLENELKQKSDFISIMVHQLRTPISALKWTFKMMLDGDLGAMDENQRTIVNRAFGSTNQMIHLLADVSAANHASEWKLHLKPEPIDVTSCIAGTVSEFSDEAKSRNITISFNHPEKLPMVMGDRDRTCLIVQNLIENAIKYNRPGGTITVTAESFQDKLVISVHDTGMGIPLNEQKNIFGKFYRAQNAKAREKGTGLGLYVGRQIVEGLGGSMWFESNEGIGTTFFFSLPLANK